ncbi:NUDIX hydrolase [Nocardioides panacisoli]|uniref:NUDIX hydrolase n=1 Tax=Nocardioides panacisoli TaxID=627624 RepID=UPI001C6287DE|nr:NUDIX hydrolase [Nocardioides panacisoli]QYJ03906.1 NUDIX hydrolase [Nocardioides panacisoli]
MSRNRAAVRAAGVVAFRPGREVLVVHRPKYDDWSFPKGKVERGEHLAVTAVRETAEETGLHVRLGAPLPQQQYRAKGRPKTVDYWTARVVGDDDVSGYEPNDEIDDVAWVPLAEAPDRLTYDQDRETLAAAAAQRRKTRALVVLRHGQARSRKAWSGDDRQRPLLQRGHGQADRVVPLLAAYDVTRVVTSSSVRCRQTVAPYAEMTGWDPLALDSLSEEDADLDGLTAVITDLVDQKTGAVVCTHRPVLPLVFDALGLRKKHRAEDLSPAEMLVVHLRKGRVVAVERHAP